MVTTNQRRKLISLCVILLVLGSCLARAIAEDVTAVFIAPTNSFVGGSSASVWLYLMNNSASEVHRTLEPKINARFIAPPVSWDAVLTASSASDVTIAPGAFAKAEYSLDVPLALRGLASLSVSNYNEVAIRVVEPAGTNQVETLTPPEPEKAKPQRTAIAKFFDNHLSPYEPIYFLLGNYPAAEFQFSLKFQLFDSTITTCPVVTNLYFAYTQTSYWDLISSDPSFFDTSYKPSMFLYFPGLWSREDDAIQFDLQGGAEHESNGRGGAAERSIYTAYLQPKITFGKPGHLQFALQPRVWTYFWVGHNNPDIAEFRGYADLHAFLTLKPETNSWANFQIETRFRVGDDGEHPGIQIDGRYKLPFFNPTLDVQYFEGYGQTLRQYNKKAHGLRAGLCLWY